MIVRNIIIIILFVYLGCLLFTPIIYLYFRLASRAICKSYYEELMNIMTSKEVKTWKISMLD